MNTKLTGIQSTINTKANATDVYTKQETDSVISTAISNIPATDLSGYATTSYVSTNYLSKTDASSTYATKTQLSTLSDSVETVANTADTTKNELQRFEGSMQTTLSDMGNAIASKANSTDVYTKSEVYTKTETNSAISTAINNIPTTDLSSYAKLDDSTQTITANRINTNATKAGNLTVGNTNGWHWYMFGDNSNGSVLYQKYGNTNGGYFQFNTAGLHISNTTKIELLTPLVSISGNLSVPFTKLQIGEIGKNIYDINHYYFKGPSLFYVIDNPDNSNCVIFLFLAHYTSPSIASFSFILPGYYQEISPHYIAYFVGFHYTTLEKLFYKYCYSLLSDTYFYNTQTNTIKYPLNNTLSTFTKFNIPIHFRFIQTYNGETLNWEPDEIYILDGEYSHVTHGRTIPIPFNYAFTLTSNTIADEGTQSFVFNFNLASDFTTHIYPNNTTIQALGKSTKLFCLNYEQSMDLDELCLRDGNFTFVVYYGDDPSDTTKVVVSTVGEISSNRSVITWVISPNFSVDCGSIMPYIWS